MIDDDLERAAAGMDAAILAASKVPPSGVLDEAWARQKVECKGGVESVINGIQKTYDGAMAFITSLEGSTLEVRKGQLSTGGASTLVTARKIMGQLGEKLVPMADMDNPTTAENICAVSLQRYRESLGADMKACEVFAQEAMRQITEAEEFLKDLESKEGSDDDDQGE